MRLNIFSKLFLAMIISTLIMVIVMALFVNISFRTGFANFLHKGEISAVEELIVLLNEEYAKDESWDSLRGSMRKWHYLIREVRTIGPPPPPKRPPFLRRSPPPADGQPNQRPPLNPDRPPRLPTGFEPLSTRISLFDTNQQKVVGRWRKPRPKSIITDVEIKHNGVIVGWVKVRQGNSTVDKLAEKFLDQQLRNSYMIAALAMLVAILSAVLLAKHFVRPVKTISKGAKKLSSGLLETRIRVSSDDELGELADDFNKLAKTLEKNETQRKQWLVDISHELRTPIAVLRSEIEAMLDGIREPNNQRIRSLHTDVLSLGKLVDDLYQLSVSDSTEIIKDETPVDLIEIINKATESFSSLLKEKHIGLKLIAIDESIIIEGNKRTLHQLFSNLFANSYRYTNENGSIEVSIKSKTDTVEVLIQDSTPGVPEESLSLIFDRLYRVDKSRNRALGGSGLGLSICAKIVAEHEGAIHSEHSSLGGLLIRIEFPRSNKKLNKDWMKNPRYEP